MTFSRTKAVLVLLVGLAFVPGESRQDPIELIRRHRYEEAIALFRKDADGAKGEKALRALKGQSLSYQRLGSLYRTFSNFSAALMEDYYGNLIQDGASGLNHLYLGQIQFLNGRYAQAKASFEAARKAGDANPAVAEMADIFHFFSRRRLGEASASGDPGLSPKDNAAQWQLLELRGGPIPAGLSGASQRGRRCKLQVLLRSANPSQSELEAALKAVMNDGQQPEMYLDEGKNTQINFYDPFLLGTLSDACFALSKIVNLRIKEMESSHPEIASKFGTDLALAEASVRLGQLKEAAGYLGADESFQARLIKAQILARQRKTKEASGLLSLLAKEARDPSAMKDLADVHHLLGLDLDRGMGLAAKALKDRNSPPYHRTYAGLLFESGQPEAAIQQYAKGYKIEYRNRIDQIDPEYMADYSFAIFRTNKLRYEEIVETLYHLQKEFPACRQMHYCMQGISAGLARSYESQRIFRKGG
jgi:hypothetical protein